MPRQSISFTKNNDEWLKAQVESHEYSSKSEAVNDLIRRAREEQEELEFIRAKLRTAEKSGPSNLTLEEIKAKAKKIAKKIAQNGG